MAVRKLIVRAIVEGDDDGDVTDIYNNLKMFFDAIQPGFKNSPAYAKGCVLSIEVKEVVE